MSAYIDTVLKAIRDNPKRPEPVVEGEGGPSVVRGWATRWGTVYPVGDMYDEVIPRGAVRWDGETTCQVEHQRPLLLGRVDAGTLKLADLPKGLRFEVELPDTTPGRDTGTLIGRGDLTGASIHLVAVRSEWDLRDRWGNGSRLKKRPLHIVRAGLLVEVSLTARPVNRSADIEQGVLTRAVELEPTTGRKSND